MSYDPTKPYKTRILEMVKQTWGLRPGLLVVRGESPYVCFEERFQRGVLRVDHSDGVGTKGSIHYLMKTYEKAAVDACAMNFNDLLLCGAEPYKLQDHIMVCEENEDAILGVVRGLSRVCRQYKVVITGGETAVCNTLKGMEVGVFASGFVKKDDFISHCVKEGDVVLGLPSSGLHSNGFSFARQLFFDELGHALEDTLPWGTNVGEELSKPTRIYVKEVLPIMREFKNSISGAAHITGGAFSKLGFLLSPRIDIVLDELFEPLPVFNHIFENGGLSSFQMYTRFNCGTGFLLFARAEAVRDVVSGLCDARVVGRVRRGSGKILVKSSFDGSLVRL